jgi:hypothetical protein
MNEEIGQYQFLHPSPINIPPYPSPVYMPISQQYPPHITQYPPIPPIWSFPVQPPHRSHNHSIDLKLVDRNTKKDTRCYTCKPRGKVKKHIINSSQSGNFVFHHDMHKRPVVVVTSLKHIHTINDMAQEEIADLFKSIRDFATFWNITDYQVSFNMGRWQNHEHFYCKIRLPEKIVSRMRRDHFQYIKMESNYEDRDSGGDENSGEDEKK